ncbi:MAG TPA: TIGR02302 family protein [Xanthobacteraceae bacterium]|nr:TIGR02302 family protein [Xanthobacteraceae bacterium]
MTTTPESTKPESGRSDAAPGEDFASEGLAAARQLSVAVRRARGAIMWERTWPALAAVGTAAGIFLIASWAGLWLVLPPIGRLIGVGLTGALLVVALLPALRIRSASRLEALGRLDRESRLPHRPATALADHLASRPDDPVAIALWRAHIGRMAEQMSRLRAGLPRPRLAALDPRAVRALVLLGLVATFFMAPGDHVRRMSAAFDWSTSTPPAPYRIDAWVTPPAYTGRAPVMLPGLRSDETAQAAPDAGVQAAAQTASALTVPVGSELIVRVTGLDDTPVRIEGGIATAPEPEEAAPAAQDAPKAADAKTGDAKTGQEQRFVINAAGAAHLAGRGGETVSWRFEVVPDRAPTIAFTKDPQVAGRTGLALAYKVDDDYGVASAEAKFTAVPAPRPFYALKGTSVPAPRVLVPPPDFALPLPGARARAGASQTTKDFAESPWAGVKVALTLTARDEAGNIGFTEPRQFVLPARSFTNPLARALIEQRRSLALDADARPRVERALDALAIAPERFTPDPSHFMGLRTAYYRLSNARSDEDLRGVVDYLWDVAIRIEDGDLSDVEKQLRAAQEALQQALDRGASEDEIKRLAQDLRQAMDKFLQALAEQMRRDGDTASRPLDRNTRTVRPDDLRKMLDRIEEMAKNGARDAARQMLSELQNMLNSLQAGRQQQRQQGQSAMSEALDKLGDMIQQQQKLRDRTFREGREPGDQQGQQPGEDEQDGAFSDLKQNQEKLRQQLREMREKMQQAMRGKGQQGQKGQGQQGQGEPGQQGQGEPGEGGEPGSGQLGEAEQAMREAEQALGQGDGTGAVDAQNEALQALRKGAQSMAQAMQQQPGPGGQPGSPSGEMAERNDPLGRPMRSRDYGDDVTVKVPEEMDMQRARRVLEELRRRFGEPERPRLELDYLERLLKDF